jgi:hypothetical protein
MNFHLFVSEAVNKTNWHTKIQVTATVSPDRFTRPFHRTVSPDRFTGTFHQTVSPISNTLRATTYQKQTTNKLFWFWQSDDARDRSYWGILLFPWNCLVKSRTVSRSLILTTALTRHKTCSAQITIQCVTLYLRHRFAQDSFIHYLRYVTNKSINQSLEKPTVPQLSSAQQGIPTHFTGPYRSLDLLHSQHPATSVKVRTSVLCFY